MPRLRQLASAAVAMAARFLGPVAGSVKGIVTTEEFVRSLLAAIGSGSAVSVALLVLSALSANVAVIAPNPAVAAVLSFGLVHAADLLRRLYHVAPSPAKAAAPTAAEVNAKLLAWARVAPGYVSVIPDAADEYLAKPPGSVS